MLNGLWMRRGPLRMVINPIVRTSLDSADLLSVCFSLGATQLVLSLRKEYSAMDAMTGALTPALLLADRDQLDSNASR